MRWVAVRADESPERAVGPFDTKEQTEQWMARMGANLHWSAVPLASASLPSRCVRPAQPGDLLHGLCPGCGHTLDLHPNIYAGTAELTGCLVCELIALRDTLTETLASSAQTP